MATLNPFDLLNDDAEDPSQIAAQQELAFPAKKAPEKAQAQPKPAAAAAPGKAAKLPSKPLPPAEAVREARNDTGRGGRGGRGYGGYGRGRGGGGASGGYRREYNNDENSFGNTVVGGGQGPPEDGDTGNPSERRGGYGGPRPYRGGRRGGYANGEAEGERPPRRQYERRSGTGRGNEIKREGSGRGNWGTETDEIVQVSEETVNENVVDEKPAEEVQVDEKKDSPTNEPEEKEPEDKVMTLEEYQKVLEEKRKALQALKTEERKVDAKEFESMQQLSNKKNNDDIFIKLGSDKDKKKEAAEKEERARKSLHIDEFLKPADGERYYGSGRGRGRGRGPRGSAGGGTYSNAPAPYIEDPGQFPTLGAM